MENNNKSKKDSIQKTQTKSSEVIIILKNIYSNINKHRRWYIASIFIPLLIYFFQRNDYLNENKKIVKVTLKEYPIKTPVNIIINLAQTLPDGKMTEAYMLPLSVFNGANNNLENVILGLSTNIKDLLPNSETQVDGVRFRKKDIFDVKDFNRKYERGIEDENITYKIDEINPNMGIRVREFFNINFKAFPKDDIVKDYCLINLNYSYKNQREPNDKLMFHILTLKMNDINEFVSYICKNKKIPLYLSTLDSNSINSDIFVIVPDYAKNFPTMKGRVQTYDGTIVYKIKCVDNKGLMFYDRNDNLVQSFDF